MGKVAVIDTLPEAVRLELAAGLKGSGWGDIDGWTAWLTERGYEISRAAVGRFNAKTKQRFQQAWQDAEQTSALAAVLVANKQDDGAILKANEMLASDGLLRVQLALREVENLVDDLRDTDDPDSKADAAGLVMKLAMVHSKIVKGVADLNLAGIKRADWQAALNEKLKQADTAAETAAKKAGVSPEGIAAIRAAIQEAM
jgi:hypothetical protein